MLLTLHTLPQLAISAKLLCLLMVVICGAVPSMVRSVRLYNQCSHGTVRVDSDGHVFAGSTFDYNDPSQNLTLISHGFFGNITIWAPEAQRYICFNKRWKLVGLKNFRASRCEFMEHMTPDYYFQYRSAANKKHSMGFSSRGHPINRTLASQPHRFKCFNFLKNDSDFDILSHNKRITGGNSPHAAPPRHGSPPSLPPGDVGHHRGASRPQEGRARKVPAKNEPTGKVRHHHGRSKNMARKPS